mgnify:CR=1 FL=1
MDYEELLRGYIKIFVLVLEAVGQKYGNKAYQEVGKCVIDNEDLIQDIIDKEPDFHEAVTLLITTLLLKIHEKSELFGWENKENLNYLLNDLYNRHLKEATNKYLKRIGMPVIDQLSDYGSLTLFEQKKK